MYLVLNLWGFGLGGVGVQGYIEAEEKVLALKKVILESGHIIYNK